MTNLLLETLKSTLYVSTVMPIEVLRRSIKPIIEVANELNLKVLYLTGYEFNPDLFARAVDDTVKLGFSCIWLAIVILVYYSVFKFIVKKMFSLAKELFGLAKKVLSKIVPIIVNLTSKNME